MEAFAYKNGLLHAESVSIAQLAQQMPTPFYLYASSAIEENYTSLSGALSDMQVEIAYAVKANPNIAVIRTLAVAGAGADVASEGELRRALHAGIGGERIVFSGVGKTEAEIKLALEVSVAQINIESAAEFRLVGEIAESSGLTANIALRVNPDIASPTHKKIATGGGETKFGVPVEQAMELYRQAASMPNMRAIGVSVHIGSQILDAQPFIDSFICARDLAVRLREQGHHIKRIDVGGGLGVAYRPDDVAKEQKMLRDYVDGMRKCFAGTDFSIIIEPGRFLLANAGILVMKVLYVKPGTQRPFLIVDAAMNDLLRPTLYAANHEIKPVEDPGNGAPMTACDIVGPVCETGDIFASSYMLPPVQQGSLIAFMMAGAYGAAMASEYNSRPLVPELMVRGGKWAIVRQRPDFASIIRRESLPDWLEAQKESA